MDPIRSQVSPDRFFAGLTEYVFETRLGLADPPLVDYVSGLLGRFIHFDSIYRLRDPVGRRLEEVTEMMLEAAARVGEARREAHRHIGDFTLFWTGLYPDILEARQNRSRFDKFLDYREQGKIAYSIAAEIEPLDEQAVAGPVLERLSEEFEICVEGLHELRKELGGATPS
ncbi:MAG: hypothetical protein J0M17_05545 [Planctomycetes bacterium]|jgi:hypothetical protein|nr:hypothetical protein [Planctomycetota bacterium]